MTKSTRYDGWHVQPNQQNAHMMESLVNVSKTTHQLVRMGITVVGTVMGTTHPTIIVMETKEVNKLKNIESKRADRGGVTVNLSYTQLNKCNIEWESKNVH